MWVGGVKGVWYGCVGSRGWVCGVKGVWYGWVGLRGCGMGG